MQKKMNRNISTWVLIKLYSAWLDRAEGGFGLS